MFWKLKSVLSNVQQSLLWAIYLPPPFQMDIKQPLIEWG